MSGDPFWMVWSPQGNAPAFKHGTLEGAELEAKRLAGLHKDQEFIVLGSVAMYRATRVERVSLAPKPTINIPGLGGRPLVPGSPGISLNPFPQSVGGTPRE